MKIKNKQIGPLLKVLNYKMKFALARQRDKFFKELVEANEDYINNQTKIKDALSKKGKDGKPVIEDNKYIYTDKNFDKATNELNLLSEESFEINIIDDRIIKDMIQNSTSEFDIGESTLIEEFFNGPKEKEKKSKKD